ncbi:MAG: thioredoxin family protein [Planctomycetota bacterium]
MKFQCQQWFAVACLAVWAGLGAPAFGQEIQWAADLAAAKTEAARRNKPILLHFGASWCRPCQEVETFVFRNPAVARKLGETVVPVRIDYDQNPQLAAEFGVKSLPTDVVVTTSEKVIQKRNSPTEASAYVAMLAEIERAQAALANGGQAVLNEKNQLAESWEKSRPRPDGSNGLTPFDQQRPLAPGPGTTAPPRASAPTFNGIAEGNSPSPNGTPLATVTPPLTAEARPSTAFKPASPSSPSAEVPQKVTNPFATPSASASQSASPSQSASASPNEFGTRNSFAAQAPPVPSPPAEGTGQAVEGKGQVVLTGATSSDPSLALEGDCPVTLLKETKWVKGDDRLGAVHRGRIYLFASAEAQAEFLRDPDRYSPLLAGFDPVTFHEQGKLSEGKKAHGVFMTLHGKQQVVLFESEETRGKFRTNPLIYLDAIRIATERVDGKQ